ncbi:unnamed protein product [Gongylonema pulchrum]|uniref:Innexin n=1 Tax=Gongylonema pulchrum TaxID=637853 RepID=A0A183DCN5_9BILA|nr:unnamed protein product [Gongylonema pulchrum]
MYIVRECTLLNSGINVQSLTQMACDARMMDADARAATVQTIAGHMEDALEIQREVTDVSGMCVGKRWSSYVTCLYVFIKTLYLINVVGQIFLLNTFLGTDNLFYGFHILKDLLNGREWEVSGNFPRVTMCDFEVCFIPDQNLYYFTPFSKYCALHKHKCH